MKILKKNNYTLYNGNCIKVLSTMVKQNKKVDHIITDAPYEINYDYWDKTNSVNWKVILKLFDKITKKGSNIVIFQGWSNIQRIMKYIPKSWVLKNWIIYDRIKGRGAKTNLVSTREDILWFVKSNDYVFNKIPSNIKKKTGGLGKKNGCDFRALSNVWTDISPIVPWSKEKVKHPTQKPLQIMERCIKLWTNKKQIVLDPFMGSGTTGVACLQNNRKFIGIEKELSYYKISKKRMKNEN